MKEIVDFDAYMKEQRELWDRQQENLERIRRENIKPVPVGDILPHTVSDEEAPYLALQIAKFLFEKIMEGQQEGNVMTREQKLYLIGDDYGVLHHSYSGNFAVLTDGTLYMLNRWSENKWIRVATSYDLALIMEKYLELVNSEQPIKE